MAELTNHLTMDAAFRIGTIDPRIFGGFLEHMGRAVYDGVLDPKTFEPRPAVLDALRPLGFTTMRYPGGNFASGYHWRDGVGPRAQRPTVRDLAWNAIEPNAFGTNEFLALCRRMDWQPMISVNLGTGTPEEAAQWVDYCNGDSPTALPKLREAHGQTQPHGVRLWCLGNEMDGPWQLGHVDATEYANRAKQAAKMMRDVDPSIELAAAGSSNPLMPTFLEWDRQVLETLGDSIDYLALHRYIGNDADDTADYLTIGRDMDQMIEAAAGLCRYVQAVRRSKKRVYLSIDEWNVWYKDRRCNTPEVRYAKPLIEEVYNLEDALAVAACLMSFIRHADCVKLASLAQIVNVIAPLLTRGEAVLRQTTYWPLEMIRGAAFGEALAVAVAGEGYDHPRHGRVTAVDAAATLADGKPTLMLMNRMTDRPVQVRARIGGMTIPTRWDARLLTGPDAKATNRFDAPDTIAPQPLEPQPTDDGVTVHLPPLSLAVLRGG